MKFKSIAIIYVGLAPVVAIVASWIIRIVQHLDVHPFFAAKAEGLEQEVEALQNQRSQLGG